MVRSSSSVASSSESESHFTAFCVYAAFCNFAFMCSASWQYTSLSARAWCRRLRVGVMIRPYTDQLCSAADALTGWASTEHATAFNNGTCRARRQWRRSPSNRPSASLGRDPSRGALAQGSGCRGLRCKCLIHAEARAHYVFVCLWWCLSVDASRCSERELQCMVIQVILNNVIT